MSALMTGCIGRYVFITIQAPEKDDARHLYSQYNVTDMNSWEGMGPGGPSGLQIQHGF
jgi:hypothetical protein